MRALKIISVAALLGSFFLLFISIFDFKSDEVSDIDYEAVFDLVKKEDIDWSERSKITGLQCDNKNQRPFAIMYSGDKSARKYFANLSEADFVAEIPHRYIHDQPRLMGVFQCNLPEIVGPMRSGRVDHVSVASSFDAIYVPWGGSSIGKSLMKRGVVDHIDCNGEVYPGGGAACFRRSGPMSMLAKASTNITELKNVADEVGYRKEWNFEGFKHQEDIPLEERPDYQKVMVNFGSSSAVYYIYHKESNSYKRFFDNAPDIDYEKQIQYAPKNLIIVRTEKEPWLVNKNYTSLGLMNPWYGVDAQHQKNDDGQYPNFQFGDPWFDTKFEGEVAIFLNGEYINGIWKRKKGVENRFEFYDESGNEIAFVPGQIWLHVMEEYQTYEVFNEPLTDN